MPPEALASIQAFLARLQAYSPRFKGAATVEQGVKDVVSTWEKASIESGYAGAFVSHFVGNKQWV